MAATLVLAADQEVLGMFIRLAATVAALSVAACTGTVPPPLPPTDAAVVESSSRRVMPPGAEAPLFTDLGEYHYKISTNSDLAQAYFDQAMILTYGFNHSEAVRSFREASRIDPSCAMCYWGEAYALGPNINKPMDPADAPAAWVALQNALSVAGGATKKEQDVILTLTNRYAENPREDRAFLDLAYADAMRQLAATYPEDADIRTLFAESLMDTMPWNYYEADGVPKKATYEVVTALELVMEGAPYHAGAAHLYIHAVEASSPAKAEAAADRLRGLHPGAGHLVHMPSHIYIRIGRYHDASEVNTEAALADESYISQCLAQGFYPALYYPHNLHFLWSASSFEGRSKLALNTARRITALLPPENIREFTFLEEFMPIELLTLSRFGRWEETLAAPAFDPDFGYATAIRHYTRGLAMIAKGQLVTADLELTRLQAIAGSERMADLAMVSIGSTAADLLAIASAVFDGELALARGDADRSVRSLKHAVALEDSLSYSEPPPWYLPARDVLGRALIRKGAAAEAERVFREQLEITPRSGWTLYGLAASLRAQGMATEANVVDTQFKEAWKMADVELNSSVF